MLNIVPAEVGRMNSTTFDNTPGVSAFGVNSINRDDVALEPVDEGMLEVALIMQHLLPIPRGEPAQQRKKLCQRSAQGTDGEGCGAYIYMNRPDYNLHRHNSSGDEWFAATDRPKRVRRIPHRYIE